MNALQTFIASKPCGFLRNSDMPALIALDRLCPVLVRCGGCRLTCAAQDAAHLIRCIEAGKDYVRDVSITHDAQLNAAAWHYEPTQEEMQARFAKPPPLPEHARARLHAHVKRVLRTGPTFNEADCGGAFDGFTVTSDADPGL